MDTCRYESVLLSPCMLPFSVYVSRFVARVLCWMREYSPPLLFVAALAIVPARMCSPRVGVVVAPEWRCGVLPGKRGVCRDYLLRVLHKWGD